jgi:CRISPR-associated exonuclease Cas4
VNVSEKEWITGVQINYLYVCKTKLWLFSHKIAFEQESDDVMIGKLLHETYFAHKKKNLILGKIAVDFIENNQGVLLHEIKKSGSNMQGTVMQVAYYMYYIYKLSNQTVKEAVINVVSERRIIKIKPNPELFKNVEKSISDVKKVISSEKVPEPKRTPYCRKCAYRDFCWG